MTIREALIKSIEETRKGAGGTGHGTFTEFTVDLSAVYMITVAQVMAQVMAQDMPELETLGGKTGGKGIPFEEVTCKDAIRVFSGRDVFRFTSVFRQARGFLEWYLDQNVPEGLYHKNGSIVMWTEGKYIEEMWNRYANIVSPE